MWILLLLTVFLVVGLLPRGSRARDRGVVVGTTVLVVGAEAVLKHLL
jgi:hypothetical protein